MENDYNSATKSLDWVKIDGTNQNQYIVDLRCNLNEMLPPLEAAKQTIKDIVKKYPPPYTLMLSGGIDSQAMLYAWHQSGYPYQTRSVKYTGGFNDHDLANLSQFADAIGVNITYTEFDVLTFLETEYDQWATEYDCSSPQICSHMKMCSDIEGTIIFSGNFCEKRRGFISYTTMGIKRYGEKAGKSIVPFFFMESSALTFSFLPFLPESFEREKSYERKWKAYVDSGFPVIMQPEKYTGFEEIKKYYDTNHKHRVTLKNRLRYASKASKRVFDLLLRYPYEEKLSNPKYTFVTNWTKNNNNKEF